MVGTIKRIFLKVVHLIIQVLGLLDTTSLHDIRRAQMMHRVWGKSLFLKHLNGMCEQKALVWLIGTHTESASD